MLSTFKDIIGNQGPLTQQDDDYKGSTYNVQGAWDDCEITYIPLSLIATNNPVLCAIYAKSLPVWKQFKRFAREHEDIKQSIFKAKIKSKIQTPKIKYGYRVQGNHNESLCLA
jgi:hypothetical protein